MLADAATVQFTAVPLSNGQACDPQKKQVEQNDSEIKNLMASLSQTEQTIAVLKNDLAQRDNVITQHLEDFNGLKENTVRDLKELKAGQQQLGETDSSWRTVIILVVL